MKYFIVYPLEGDAKRYHENLTDEVSQKFGVKNLTSHIPAHITLKSPFETNNVYDVEILLKNFAMKQKSYDINIDGFGNFDKYFIFLDVNFSADAKKVQSELIEKIEKYGFDVREFDKNWNPHSTLAYADKDFEKIWNYLGRKNSPRFDILFDNISILKKQEMIGVFIGGLVWMRIEVLSQVGVSERLIMSDELIKLYTSPSVVSAVLGNLFL